MKTGKNLIHKIDLHWSGGKQIFTDISLAWFPALIAFFYIPSSLFLANQDEFNNNLIVLVPFVFVLFLSFALLLLLIFFNEKIRGRIAVILFFCGIFIALSDSMAPWKFTALTGFSEEISTDKIFLLKCLESFLAFILLIPAIKISPKRIRGFGTLFVWFALIIQIIFFGTSISSKSHFGEDHYVLAPEPQPQLEKGNVYHIVVDSYHRDLFLYAIERADLLNKFDGFVFFMNNRANYTFTAPSYASYMTGSLYKTGSIKKWQYQAENYGIMKKFYDTGYSIWQYAIKNSWQHQSVSHFTTIENIGGNQETSNNTLALVDMSLRRIVPLVIQPASMKKIESSFSYLFGIPASLRKMSSLQFRSLNSLLLFEQCIADENSRPKTGQYVYLHPYLPHAPYVFDENCSLSTESDFGSQSICVTKVVDKFFDTLKDLGRYEQATIILQSDHGAPEIVRGANPFGNDLHEEVAKIMDESNHLKKPMLMIDNLSRALLAVKPPNKAGERLVISPLLTQLADVPATLFSLAEIDSPTEQGMSVFDNKFPPEREVDIFVGYHQMGKMGQSKIFGEDLFEGEMNHLTFSLDQEWKVKPNINVSWD